MRILILVSVLVTPIFCYYELLNRPFTQKSFNDFPLEKRIHHQIKSDSSMSFVFPKYCGGNKPKICSNYKINYQQKKKYIGLKLIGAIEYRNFIEDGYNTRSGEGGIIIGAKHNFMDINLDARIFGELSSNKNFPSYDREFVDKQSGEVNDLTSFASFSRYRGNMTFYFDIGIVSIARDVIHWGPGLYNNFIFNQNAIPFNHLSYQTQIGPVKVISLYGSLLIENRATSNLNQKKRDLYAHRYEFNIGKNLLLGVSEQIILYENNHPFFFVPFVPLFIEKSLIDENSNNGNLSFDLSYRMPKLGSVYSELFIDDMESPASLFTKDFIQNKWGVLMGIMAIYDIENFSNGVILEYARLEPYSYSHFVENTAQTAHQNYPLGNQLGPNSQVVNIKIYSRYMAKYYLSGKIDIIWKGSDIGSQINDITPRNSTMEGGKTFLKGVDPYYSLQIFASAKWGMVKTEVSCTFLNDEQLVSRLALMF